MVESPPLKFPILHGDGVHDDGPALFDAILEGRPYFDGIDGPLIVNGERLCERRPAEAKPDVE